MRENGSHNDIIKRSSTLSISNFVARDKFPTNDKAIVKKRIVESNLFIRII